jgi:hypothetical protein
MADVPELGLAVVIGGGEQLAVGGELDRRGGGWPAVVMYREHPEGSRRRRCGGVPQRDVVARGGERVAHRGEREVDHRVALGRERAAERTDVGGVTDVDQHRAARAVGHGDRAAVGIHGGGVQCRRDRLRLACLVRFGGVCDVPQDGLALVAAAGEDRPVTGERHGAHGLCAAVQRNADLFRGRRVGDVPQPRCAVDTTADQRGACGSERDRGDRLCVAACGTAQARGGGLVDVPHGHVAVGAADGEQACRRERQCRDLPRAAGQRRTEASG